jgi:hypothetical protein
MSHLKMRDAARRCLAVQFENFREAVFVTSQELFQLLARCGPQHFNVVQQRSSPEGWADQFSNDDLCLLPGKNFPYVYASVDERLLEKISNCPYSSQKVNRFGTMGSVQ